MKTKSKSIVVSQHSAAALARLEIGATGLIVVKCKDWPDGWTPKGIGLFHPTRIDKHGEEYSGAEVFGAWDEDRAVICPYKPGDVVAVKEQYRTCKGEWVPGLMFLDGQIVYPEQESLSAFPHDWHNTTRFRAARTLPAWAVRTHLRVKSIACKRIQEVTEEECRLYGATHDGWNTERQVFQSLFKAAWSANEWHWFITGEKCNNVKGTT